MLTYRLGCLLGDGIGPEIVPAARRVVDEAMRCAGAPPVTWVDLPMGRDALAEHGSPLPEATCVALASCDGWMAGPHDSESYPASWSARGERVPGAELRHRFQLDVNLRPSRTRRSVPSVVSGVDLLIVRENSQGFYADRNMVRGSGEFMPTQDVALVVGVFTREAIRHVVRQAFRLSTARRRHVTLVHKGNVLPMAFGIYAEECQAASRDYPEVRYDSLLLDAAAARLVRSPQDFDVIVTENLFGDTLSDLAGELVGSLGMAGSINAGERYAMAQAAHGSAPVIAGQGIANPVGMLVSASLLLSWLGERHDDTTISRAAAFVDRAVDDVLAGGTSTPDLGGRSTTAGFTDAVVGALPRDHMR